MWLSHWPSSHRARQQSFDECSFSLLLPIEETWNVLLQHNCWWGYCDLAGEVGWGEVESKKRRYWDGVCSQTQHHPDLLPIHICILIVSSGWIICCSFNYQYFQNQQWLVCQLCAFNRNITVHWAKVILYIGSVFEICVAWEISWSIWKCLTNISAVSRWLAQDSPLRVARRTDMQTCPPGASPLLCKIQIQIQIQMQILIQIQRQMKLQMKIQLPIHRYADMTTWFFSRVHCFLKITLLFLEIQVQICIYAHLVLLQCNAKIQI